MNRSLSSKKFNFVYNKSIVIKTPGIIFRVSPSSSLGGVGFIVGRRLGSACARNLFKRRVRSLYNDFFISKEKEVDIIVAPKKINLSWEEIKNSFKLITNKAYDI